MTKLMLKFHNNYTKLNPGIKKIEKFNELSK